MELQEFLRSTSRPLTSDEECLRLENYESLCSKTRRCVLRTAGFPLKLRVLANPCRHCEKETKRNKTKQQKIPINTKINYRREMKLIPINMDNCLLQFHALKIFLGVLLHGSPFLILIFSM